MISCLALHPPLPVSKRNHQSDNNEIIIKIMSPIGKIPEYICPDNLGFSKDFELPRVITVTWCPSLFNSSTIFEPIKPPPPMINTFIILPKTFF